MENYYQEGNDYQGQICQCTEGKRKKHDIYDIIENFNFTQRIAIFDGKMQFIGKKH